ncbi:MAG: hypothetical protein F6K54_25985 [Okeania sp. SIO3B5]|uniref:hypothetical protein n=1 Tax=Okeania sp. SIO3B5 TaxID=2607811 RepID=UPI00140038C4|nr:hypothetical protein [Okeania sp. SIO3B5]NEO56226.1 hypothetical protein [Okeania sp. SIO3B5]
MKKVLIIDTSILCVYLGVPGKETCGSEGNKWDKVKVYEILEKEEKAKTIFVLPLATIIETGNHIAQANSKGYEIAKELGNLMKLTADNQTPWAAFIEQSKLWDAENLKDLADEFPDFASRGFALGDATIKRVADYYAKSGFDVEIITGDKGLKSYEPPKPELIPRRKKYKK